MNQVKIGKFIAQARKEKGMTQEQLAEKLGISTNAVSKWECGLCLMNMSLLKPLSNLLDVSINELLAGEKISEENLKEKSEENLLNFARCFMVKPEGGKRVSKVDTYLNCAEMFAYRSTCLKRKYGAVIVKDDAVVSTGYNGSPRGFDNCCELGKCARIEKNMHQGEGYEICRAIHAEANALLNCSRQQTLGADLYLVGINPEDNSVHQAKPCPQCARLIIQSGIENVVLRQGEGPENYITIPARDLKYYEEV